jgi:oligosaccharide repeat unit polymerase
MNFPTVAVLFVAACTILHVLRLQRLWGIMLVPSGIFFFFEFWLQFIIPHFLIEETYDRYYYRALGVMLIGLAAFFVGYEGALRLGLLNRFIRACVKKVRMPTELETSVQTSAKIFCWIGIGIVWFVFASMRTIPALDANPGRARFFFYDPLYFSYLKYPYWFGNSLVTGGIACFISYHIIRRTQVLRLPYVTIMAALLTMFLTAHRAPFFLLLCGIYITYFRFHYHRFSLWKSAALAICLFYGAMIAVYMREGPREGFEGMHRWIMGALKFGNSFIDFADFVDAMQHFGESGFLMGKTYLADVLGWVPFGWFEFRDEYRWKEWTKGLFGVEVGSGGYRLTVFGEPYFNFGYAGVIVKGILMGVIFTVSDRFAVNVVKVWERGPVSFVWFYVVEESISFVNGTVTSTYQFLFVIAGVLQAFLLVSCAILINRVRERATKSRRVRLQRPPRSSAGASGAQSGAV